MSTHGWPLGGDDAVNTGIPQRPIRCDGMVPQDAIQLRTEPLDGATTLFIHEVGTKLHCDAAHDVEGVGEQEQLGLGVQGGSLERRAYHVEPISTRRLMVSTFM